MDIEQANVAIMPALAPTTDIGNDEDAAAQFRRFEAHAYNALLDDGGRPSHPLSLMEDVVAAPGQYRDILAFWQDRSDEWQVFTKQLSRWQAFRAHQRQVREPKRFPSYVEELHLRLKRHGFEPPPAFEKAPTGFSRQLDRQDKLATWVEYLNYEFTRRDEYDKWLTTCRPGYDEAVSQLSRSGVMRPLERARCLNGDICRPSSIEIARLKFERRRLQDVIENSEARAELREYGYLQFARQEEEEEEERQLTTIRKQLETMDKRASCVSEFTRKTHPYRFALDRAERHDLLLRWMLDQVSLIEKEIRSLTSKKDRDESGTARPASFSRFKQLPPEIRLKIWTECLPTRPTVHFFEVVNHQRKRHLAHSWSSKEFRVRAAKARDSGYLAVYTLLASCREARLAVEAYYGHQSPSSRCSQQGDEPDMNGWCLDFQTFDWIPTDDLVVLCFPPIQVPQLPKAHAITLTHGSGRPARNVGLLVPKEVLIMEQLSLSDDVEGDDDANQVLLIPEFLNALRKQQRTSRGMNDFLGGIKQAYFIVEGVEGLQMDHTEKDTPSNRDVRSRCAIWANDVLNWSFVARRPLEVPLLWGSFAHGPPEDVDIDTNSCHSPRDLWWLGSGTEALGLLQPDDMTERVPARRINSFRSILERGCQDLGWNEFEGVGVLGWLK